MLICGVNFLMNLLDYKGRINSCYSLENFKKNITS